MKATNAHSFLQRNIHQCPRTTKERCYTVIPPLPPTSGNWRWCSIDRQCWSQSIAEQAACRRCCSIFIDQQSMKVEHRRGDDDVYNRVQASWCHHHTFLHAISTVGDHILTYLVPFDMAMLLETLLPTHHPTLEQHSQSVVSCTNIDSFNGEVQPVTLR